eukprot:15554991-Heterocapsa_arctica.AAC.1
MQGFPVAVLFFDLGYGDSGTIHSFQLKGHLSHCGDIAFNKEACQGKAVGPIPIEPEAVQR